MQGVRLGPRFRDITAAGSRCSLSENSMVFGRGSGPGPGLSFDDPSDNSVFFGRTPGANA